MAEFRETTSETGMKFGEIILSDEDKEALHNGLGRNWAKNIINKIIWGDVKEFYE